MAEHLAANAYPWLAGNWADIVHRHRSVGLPHALMITGASGLGKHALTTQTAEWLLCQTAMASGQAEACGQCHSCRLWAAGSHPDISVCQPEEGSRQIRVDDVRKVNDFIHQTPQISRCQVVILRPAEVLNTNAANALLKTLEEPAGESFLLLECERFGSVLPTIRSRCQRIDVKAPKQPETIHWLVQQGYSEDVATNALSASAATPLAALEWLQSDMASNQKVWFQKLLAWTQGRIRLAEITETWKNVELEVLLQWLLRLCSDLARRQLGAPAKSGMEDVDQMMGLRGLNTEHLFALYDKLLETLIRVRAGVSSINRALLLESIMIDWRGLYH